MNTEEVKKVLEDRGKIYGEFGDIAVTSLALKDILISAVHKNNGVGMVLDERERLILIEGLGMIAHKLARVVCGDPRYLDNYVDISGYAMLIHDRVGEPK